MDALLTKEFWIGVGIAYLITWIIIKHLRTINFFPHYE